MDMQKVVSAPKTDSFRFRINPEIRAQAEQVYEKCGLSLTDAINVFIQQSLNAGGFPFAVSEDNAALLKKKALSRLMKDLEEGKRSGEPIDEETACRMLGLAE